MNEININIEGYNVNGICVGCLSYNRRMFYTDDVKECFKILANIDIPDGLSVQVCWECMAAVRQVTRFQATLQKSYEVLIRYSEKHKYLYSHTDLSKHAITHLSTVRNGDVIEISTETETGSGTIQNEDNLELKEDEIKTEQEYDFDDNYDSLPTDEQIFTSQDNHDTLTSEDDVKLSKLKEKKKKKTKKHKTKTKKHKKADKKLDNFSPGAVKCVTVDESDMIVVRDADKGNEFFLSLKYRCMDCILNFASEKLMNHHFEGRHQPKESDSTQCNICCSYVLKKYLVQHKLKHFTVFQCNNEDCDFKSTNKKIMDFHLLSHGTEQLFCDVCNKEFSSKSRLNYHKNICKKEKPQCDCCGKVFANKATLKYHLKLLPAKKPEETKLVLPCKGCDKVFYSKKSYRAHVVIHDGLQYPCALCGKLFQWKRNLARHMRNHRDREKGALHECRQCGKRFASRDCYNNHMRFSKKHVAEESLSHTCSYCGKKFATRWCMVDHVDWDHLKKIKYRCSTCLKPFKTAKIMIAHQKNIHGGGKAAEVEGEHLCEICGKSYKTEKRLKGHVWAMHTHRSTAKSHKCPLCPVTFTWQTSIYKHMKMHQQHTHKVMKIEEMYDSMNMPDMRLLQNDLRATEPFDETIG